MTLLELLKQFKKIEPGADYSAVSRRSILAQAPAGMRVGVDASGAATVVRGWSAQRTFWKIIETGAAVALTGFFVLLVSGALNGTGPQYAAIDTRALHAEAQAVDMQIQLANLNYASPESSAASTMSIAGVKAGAAKPSSPKAAATMAPATASGSAAGTTTTVVSLDQALQSLSQ